jgi:hypothetical protein
MPTDEQVKALAESMWQLLDDMGKDAQSVCLAAKARARIAYQPFNVPDLNWDDWMSLAEAEKIVREADEG